MRAAITAIIISQLVLTPVAFADPPPCTTALSLKHGQAVPCLEGVLFPPAWALEATRLRTVKVPELENELRLLRSTSTARVTAMTAELKLERRFSTEQARLLTQALDTYQPQAWYEHPGLWVVVGLVVGAAATVGIVHAVKE
jgi:hypothetical protein